MSPRRRSFGAWLSLFAMLMIVVGPLIGQGTALAHGAGHSMPMSMAMDGMACDDMPGMTHAARTSAPGDGHHPLVIWEKCGYCSLLFQHPALIESAVFCLPLGVPASTFLSVVLVSQPVAAPVFPGARSRAPPRSPD